MMAQANGNKKPADTLFTLSEEALKHLEAMKDEFDKADSTLDMLEEIGQDVSVSREKIAWGRKAREVLLRGMKKE